jgi:hypothetical protein
MAAAVAATVGLTGCASTWDTMSSKRFRDDPFGVMFQSDDPMTVLRENPDGEARARAMRTLKEPGAEPEQTEALEILSAAATTDPSPWVRVAAIDASTRWAGSRTPAPSSSWPTRTTRRAASRPVRSRAGRAR